MQDVWLPTVVRQDLALNRSDRPCGDVMIGVAALTAPSLAPVRSADRRFDVDAPKVFVEWLHTECMS
jgi:hypothetical protein